MISAFLQDIYNDVIDIIRKTLGNSSFAYEKSYWEYLSNKYEALLCEFASEESDTMVRAIVDSYKKDEIRIWENLRKDEMLSLLNSDPAFEHLQFLSNVAFEQASQSKRMGVFGNDEKEYQKRLEELALCLDAIKSYNINAAKELLSESILDIEYFFQKSDTMSLRLSKVH